jgi:regulatory protein
MSLKKTISHADALEKSKKLCALEERCRYDVRKKLFDWGVSSGDTEKIINQLVDEKFLDEWRFARQFASGKFRNNKWGKVKISYELVRKNIARNIIEDAIRRIEEGEYLDVLRRELMKKQRSISADDENDLRSKLHRYASSKGYEFELINQVLDDMVAFKE